jgi:hypothetical protein
MKMFLTQFEFACELFGYEKAISLDKSYIGLVDYYPGIDSMTKIATIDFKDNMSAKLLISSQGEKIIYFKDLNVIFKKR